MRKHDSALYSFYLWEPLLVDDPDVRLRNAAARACGKHPFTRNTECMTSFYPYSSLKSTIKITDGVTRIRISDVLRSAPEEVLEALAHVLISRAARRKPRAEYTQRYHEYLEHPEVEERHARIRVERKKKILRGPVGRFYHLDEMFDRLNLRYFKDRLPKPTLSWSPRVSRRQLGYHDRHLNLIVISRWLDRKTVPLMVADFILYHEMLHTDVPCEYRNGKRIVHTQEFKRRERLFEHYADVIEWF